jgi:hypothetical protein
MKVKMDLRKGMMGVGCVGHLEKDMVNLLAFVNKVMMLRVL